MLFMAEKEACGGWPGQERAAWVDFAVEDTEEDVAVGGHGRRWNVWIVASPMFCHVLSSYLQCYRMLCRTSSPLESNLSPGQLSSELMPPFGADGIERQRSKHRHGYNYVWVNLLKMLSTH